MEQMGALIVYMIVGLPSHNRKDSEHVNCKKVTLYRLGFISRSEALKQANKFKKLNPALAISAQFVIEPELLELDS